LGVDKYKSLFICFLMGLFFWEEIGYFGVNTGICFWVEN